MIQTSKLISPLLGMLSLAGASNPLVGQELTGRVLASEGDRGVQHVLIEVFDEERQKIGVGHTDDRGRFAIALSRSGGPFLMEMWALSYRRAAVDSLFVDDGERLDVGDVRLETSPIPLDTTRVVVERRGLLPGRELVRRRQLLGKGTFLSGAVIAAAKPRSLLEYLAEESGLLVRTSIRSRYPFLYSPRAPRNCVHIQINHWPGLMGYATLDHLLLDQIAAIEIYETPRDIPQEKLIGLDAAFAGCGLINIWLWNSW